jgi:hypothetical protein
MNELIIEPHKYTFAFSSEIISCGAHTIFTICAREGYESIRTALQAALLLLISLQLHDY